MAKVTLEQWAERTQKRIESVTKTAISSFARDANKPTAQGGRMRVDTGFLRNSQAAKIGSLPVGPSEGPRITKNGIEWRDALGSPNVDAELLTWKMDQPFFIGWTANYAKYREAHDGFLEAELMRWSEHIQNAIRQHDT